MPEIKAIETIYNGYRFRSRLEARWAVFFDALGIEYLYEAEGYQLSDGTLYLPDFYLPESDSFFEVKGVMGELDMHKIEMLMKDTGKAVTIGYPNFAFEPCDRWEYKDEALYEMAGSGALCKCKKCGKHWFMGLNGIYTCQCCGEYDGDHHYDVVVWSFSKNDPPDTDFGDGERALRRAKQARFEFGESPEVWR